MSDSCWSSDVRSPSESAAPAGLLPPVAATRQTAAPAGAVHDVGPPLPAAAPPKPDEPLPEHAPRTATQAANASAEAIRDFLTRWSRPADKRPINKGSVR